MGFFDKLKSSLGKTREAFSDKVNNVFKVFVKVDEEFFEELEEVEAVVDGLLVEVAEKRLDIVVSRVLFSGWCNSLVLSVPKSSAQKSFLEDVFFEDESLEVFFEAVFLLAVVLEV